MAIQFTKMHGAGNDFVLIDAPAQNVPDNSMRELARKMCDRRFGVGADGLLVLWEGASGLPLMRIFNPDGSEAPMCGNGTRCFARFLARRAGQSEGRLCFETPSFETEAQLSAENPEWVEVLLGSPVLRRGSIPMIEGDPEQPFVGGSLSLGEKTFKASAMRMGGPHLTIFVESLNEIDLPSTGPLLEAYPWFPEKINVTFVERTGPATLTTRTWERGAGHTWACGTGACAAVVSMVQTGESVRKFHATSEGGTISIEYLESGRVILGGPAVFVFDGVWLQD
ncbi:MAG: diaminopimelate epimerase [Fimbriimonadaceae bacterium]